MWSRTPPKATGDGLHRRSARGSDERPRLRRDSHCTWVWVAQRFTAAISVPFSMLALAAEGDCGAQKEFSAHLLAEPLRLYCDFYLSAPTRRCANDAASVAGFSFATWS